MADRYVPNGTPITEHERELLVILMEECGEVIQAASKIVRFGRESSPDGENVAVLGQELGDLSEVVGRLKRAELIRWSDLVEGSKRKQERLDKYLQTSDPEEETACTG